jgi:hypothetical protein
MTAGLTLIVLRVLFGGMFIQPDLLLSDAKSHVEIATGTLIIPVICPDFLTQQTSLLDPGSLRHLYPAFLSIQTDQFSSRTTGKATGAVIKEQAETIQWSENTRTRFRGWRM